jgi:hypothetical protein
VGLWSRIRRAFKGPEKVIPHDETPLGMKTAIWAQRQRKHQDVVETPLRGRSNLVATNRALDTKDILSVLQARALKVAPGDMGRDKDADLFAAREKETQQSIPDAWKRLAAGADLQVHEPSIWKKEDRRTGVSTWGRRVTRESMARSFETGAEFKKVRWQSMALWLHDADADFEEGDPDDN